MIRLIWAGEFFCGSTWIESIYTFPRVCDSSFGSGVCVLFELGCGDMLKVGSITACGRFVAGIAGSIELHAASISPERRRRVTRNI
jgi:hypothetical protein